MSTELRFIHLPADSSEDDPGTIVVVPFDPASIGPGEREILRMLIAWPETSGPLLAPTAEKLTPEEVMEEARRRDHPEWWPDTILDVCEGRFLEGHVVPSQQINRQGLLASNLLAADEPTPAAIVAAALREYHRLWETG